MATKAKAAPPVIRVGPVLSFRGSDQVGGQLIWRVTALIGIGVNEPVPTLTLAGKPGAAPVELHRTASVQILRYDLTVPLGPLEQKISYSFSCEAWAWSFTVPNATDWPRFAYVSCNGFSSPTVMKKLSNPADWIWNDVLANHDVAFRPANYALDKEQMWHEAVSHAKGLQRFHVMLMGGDQIYFDSIWEEIPELRRWVSLSHKDQLAFKVSNGLRAKVENYYFDLYLQRWLNPKRGAWPLSRQHLDAADAMASIPTVMIWDDHDIFDGWGSYSPEMQRSPVFQTLFDCARSAFWVFQMQHRLKSLPALQFPSGSPISTDDPQFMPVNWSANLAGDPLALPMVANQPGFSFAHRHGSVAIYVADLRTERSQRQIMGQASWRALGSWLEVQAASQSAGTARPRNLEHVFVMSSVPVVHPLLSLADLAAHLPGSDNVAHSMNDDLQDHWTHENHHGEQKRLAATVLDFTHKARVRVLLLSGDVHVAALGALLKSNDQSENTANKVFQFTSSAVVHPAPSGLVERLFLAYLNNAAKTPQQIGLDYKAVMLPFPDRDSFVMPARNWLALEAEAKLEGVSVWGTWRCERDGGFTNHLHRVEPAS